MVELGAYGRIIGFFACLIYFGILNSAIGHGQTVGKKLMGIKVLDRHGQFISISRSILRAAILCLPGILNNLPIPLNQSMFFSFIGWLLALIIFGLGGVLAYLFIFNKKSRQSVNDLAVGSYVVRANMEGDISTTPIWKGHFVIILICCVVVLASDIILVLGLMKQELFEDLFKVQQAVQNSDGISTCSVARNWSCSLSGKAAEDHSKTSGATYLSVSGVCLFDPFKEPDRIDKIASLIVKLYPDMIKLNELRVSLSYGYDIGIASFRMTKNQNFSASDLRLLENK